MRGFAPRLVGRCVLEFAVLVRHDLIAFGGGGGDVANQFFFFLVSAEILKNLENFTCSWQNMISFQANSSC